MPKNNDVFRVLIGSSAMDTAGDTIFDLAVGQIGVFDSVTGLSLDGTVASDNYFLAMAVDKDGDGVVDDIWKSSGQGIQADNVTAYQASKYKAAKPEITNLTIPSAVCGKEYGIRLEFRNGLIYNMQGYNQYSKYYSIITGCCDPCDDPCAEVDVNVLVKDFINIINEDKDGLVIARGVDPTSGSTIVDMDTFITTNAPGTAGRKIAKLQLETVPVKVRDYCAINLMYFKPRETTMILSLVEGFECSGTTQTVIQELEYEQGTAVDVKQREYIAGGWNGTPGPYRQSSVTGLPLDDFYYQVEKGATYDRLNLTYDFKSLGVDKYYTNHLTTEVYMKVANRAELKKIADILDDLNPTFTAQGGNLV